MKDGARGWWNVGVVHGQRWRMEGGVLRVNGGWWTEDGGGGG
jgi:hypothetical protein